MVLAADDRDQGPHHRTSKQDMWKARREPRGQVFCGERQGKQCDLSIDQLRTWKGLVRVRFAYNKTAAAVLEWAKENGIVLADEREKLPAASPLSPKSSARPARSRTRCGLATGSRRPALTSGASGTSGSGLATPAIEVGDQHLVTQDAIATAPTAETVTLSWCETALNTDPARFRPISLIIFLLLLHCYFHPSKLIL